MEYSSKHNNIPVLEEPLPTTATTRGVEPIQIRFVNREYFVVKIFWVYSIL